LLTRAAVILVDIRIGWPIVPISSIGILALPGAPIWIVALLALLFHEFLSF
jgi:hypothetical protein